MPPSHINDDESYFRIASIWSKAGVGTSVVLEPRPLLPSSSPREEVEGSDSSASLITSQSSHSSPLSRIVFDLGSTPVFDESIPAKVVCISHGHIDHVGGIFNHARAHAMLYGGGGSVPTYYVPIELVPQLEAARTALSAMDAFCLDDDNDAGGSGGSGYVVDEDDDDNNKDAGRVEETTCATKGVVGRRRREKSIMNMSVVGVRPGEEIELTQIKGSDGKRLFLRTFAVSHGSHPALGYLLLTRHRPALREEYRGLSGKEIGALVRSGVRVKEEIGRIKAEVAYTGDTSVEGLLWTKEDKKREEDEERKENDCEVVEEEATASAVSSGASAPHPNDGGGGGGFGIAVDDDNIDEAKRRRRKDTSRRYLRQALREAPLLLCESTFLGPASDASLRDMAQAKAHLRAVDVVEVLRSHGWAVDDDGDGDDNNGDCDSDSDIDDGDGDCDDRISPERDEAKHDVEEKDDVKKKKKKKKLVLLHISARHRPASRALDLLLEVVPPGLARRTNVAITSFLSNEEKSTRFGGNAGGDRGGGRRESGGGEVSGNGQSNAEGWCLADLVRGNGCINLAEYGGWKLRNAASRGILT